MSYDVNSIYESRLKADAEQREGTMTDGYWREQLEQSKEIALNNTELIAPRKPLPRYKKKVFVVTHQTTSQELKRRQ